MRRCFGVAHGMTAMLVFTNGRRPHTKTSGDPQLAAVPSASTLLVSKPHYNSNYPKNGLSEIRVTGSKSAPFFILFYRWRYRRFSLAILPLIS